MAPAAPHASSTLAFILVFHLVLYITVPEHDSVIWAGLSSFIHHVDPAASEPTKVIVSLRGTRTTYPAELVAAEGTGHVIAASVLFDSGAAHGAEGHVSTVFFDPALELSFHGFIATDILAVPGIPTLEAHICAARGTNEPFSLLIWRSNVRFTSWFDAPTNQRIRIEQLLVLEARKLLD